MNIVSWGLRAIDPSGTVYDPYAFEGDWTGADKAIISAVIDKYVPQRVDAGFNNWVFIKRGDNYYAKRYTWESCGLFSTSVQALAALLEDYYTHKAGTP